MVCNDAKMLISGKYVFIIQDNDGFNTLELMGL